MITSKPYDSYNNLNNLKEISFEAGSDQTFEFDVYEDDSLNLDIVISGTWLLCPYADYSDNLDIDYSLNVNGHIVTLTLLGSATINLSGKYIQQLILLDSSGNSFISQGIITITPSGSS